MWECGLDQLAVDSVLPSSCGRENEPSCSVNEGGIS
jgi:hypothetical protein